MTKNKPAKAPKDPKKNGIWGVGSVIKDGGHGGQAARPEARALFATNILGERIPLPATPIKLSTHEEETVQALFNAWNHYAKSTWGEERFEASQTMFAAIKGLMALHPLSNRAQATTTVFTSSGGTDDSKDFYKAIEQLAEDWVYLKNEIHALEEAKRTLIVDASVAKVIAFSPEYNR